MMNESPASLAATMILDLTADDASIRDADDYTRYLLIRDFRDDFASADDATLADARLTDDLIRDIMIELSRRLDPTPRTSFDY